MKNLTSTKGCLLAIVLFVSALMNFDSAQAQTNPRIRNIILVHGAFVDGSGWQAVYHQLTEKGYHVSITQQPLTSFEADVTAVQRVIDQQDGPCLLVGHSYGGAVITIAGNHPKVAGLVYIAAHAPDEGESEADNGKKYPSAYKSLIKGADGFDMIDPQRFPADFAGDLPIQQARFMSISQMPVADKAFHAIIHQPAWKTKPSWYMVAQADRIINPDLERLYATRARSKVVKEIPGGSHSIFASHPKAVADLVVTASEQAGTFQP
ncbi:alpha/beta hydrolase [Paraflavitalea pollutisoli]|uniref:alpha/beta hydrolase n=1 Tax=Paraflavitalea pollutisoli TaxID=3034143 RepID=UPI0023EBA380|nr:alpha/beta hydrolase [Paraflavitalea sp. H1-2-19X]